MKKILFAISMMFVLASCSHDNIGMEPQAGEGTTLVNFSVQLPEMQVATRSFTQPAITKLHLVVFDENGYFVQAAEAKGTFGVTSGVEYNFTAELMQSPYKRIVHFIANSPVEIDSYEYGSETTLINALTTSDAQDAYWQRVELANGILEGNNAMVTAFTKVPLVRNFVKISFVNNATTAALGNFTDVSIAVVNVPNKGTVAPFNVNSGEYAEYSEGTAYDTLNEAGYNGYEPSDMEIVNTDPTAAIFNSEHYIYERRQDTNDVDYTYVIIKGKYNGGKESFYKVDLIYDDEGNVAYYNLLRNFNYVININSVLGDGYDTAAAAAAAAASNNISASIDTNNLLNISDGTSRLYVEYVNKVITKSEPFTLKYKYLPNISSTASSNGLVDIKDVKAGYVIADVSTATTDDTDGWRTITITPNQIDGETKTQSVTIKAGALQRKVSLTLREPWNITVNATKSANTLGSAATVTLSLPSKLPEAIFPLEFVIVETGHSISPDANQNNLPVRTGLNSSGQTVNGGQYFGFVKKVEWSDYNSDNGSNILCYFKLNKAVSGNLTVNVYNEYFTQQ